MKNAKTILAILLALCMILALAACGETAPAAETSEAEAPTEAPVGIPEPTEEPEEELPSVAGTYSFEYTDLYGDVSNFTVEIEDGAGFTLTADGAMNGTFTGTKWINNGDGTFTTKATINPMKVDFSDAVGCVTWVIDGDKVTPKGYTVPTEFLTKGAPDPAIGAEAVGIYTFAFVNSFGSTVPYIVWVNADNTYTIYMDNSFKGLATYEGNSWTISSDGVVSFAPFTLEEGIPDGAWFVEGSDGFSSSWQLHADGTCEPVGFTSAECDTSKLSEDIYPAYAHCVGIYTFATVNSFGSVLPYILWLNADGTATIYINNSFKGLLTYTADEWTDNGDGTVSIGALSFPEGTGIPDGTWFDSETFESSWTLNDDGTCIPVGYVGDPCEVDTSALPEEIYPRFNSNAGVYYFGTVNAFGSTVPYAVVLKEDGTALVIVDSSFKGASSFAGTWTDNGDGTVTVGELVTENGIPDGSWFDAANGCASTWSIAGGFAPVGFTGEIVEVSSEDLSADAQAMIEAF